MLVQLLLTCLNYESKERAVEEPEKLAAGRTFVGNTVFLSFSFFFGQPTSELYKNL